MSRTYRLPFTPLRLSPTEAFPRRRALGYPLLPVVLHHGSRRIRVISLLDSGADDCLFPASIGRLLGLTVEAGGKQPFMGAGAFSNLAYFHRVVVEATFNTVPVKFPLSVGFSTAMDIPKIGLLGHAGFFDRFEEIAFRVKEQCVTLTL